MNVYAVIPQNDGSTEAVKARVESIFPEQFLKAGDRVWMVASPDDIVSFSKKLHIAGDTLQGDLSFVFIFSVVVYWGHAPVSVWQWIKTKLEAATIQST